MSSHTRPTISVIVVNFNAGAFLGLCIDRIRKSTTAVELIVVDNHSKDISKIRALGINRKPNEKYIQNDRNLGFSAAVNIGAAVASGELLVVINPDCLVWPHTIDRLCNSLKDQQEVGIVGGLVFGIHGREQTGCRRYDVTPIRSIGKMLGKLLHLNNMPTIDMTYEPIPKSSIEVDAVSGSFFAVRKSLYTELDGLDEDYFLHFEDLDFCRRVREAGYGVVFNPNVSVIHVGAVSSGVKSVEIVRYKHRSLKIYFRKYFSRFSLAVHVVLIMSQFYVWLRWLYQLFGTEKTRENLSDGFEGIWDGTNHNEVFVIGDQCQLLLSVVMRLAARGYNLVVETSDPQTAPKIPRVSWVTSEYRAKLPVDDYPGFAWTLCLGSAEELIGYQKCFVHQHHGSLLLIETGLGMSVLKQSSTFEKTVVMETNGDWLNRASLCVRLQSSNGAGGVKNKSHKNNELEVNLGLGKEDKTVINDYEKVHVDDISELCLDVFVGISNQEININTKQILKDAIDRFNQRSRSLYN